MDDVTPQDLGLPEKFRAYRPGTRGALGQYDLIERLVLSDKRFSLLCAPPGAGKTVIYMSAVHVMGGRTLVVTGTRGLQDQISSDFACMGMVDIRGQNNYECLAVRPGRELENYAAVGTRCDHGPCHHDVQCSLKKKGCEYYDQVAIAARSRYVVTNYRFWMTLNRFKDPNTLGEFDNLILDEAHVAPDQLSSFCTVTLTQEDVGHLLDMKLPELDNDRDNWIDWAKEALSECRERFLQVKASLLMAKTAIARARCISMMDRLTDLGQQLRELSMAHKWRNSEPSTPNVFIPGVQTDWVAEYTKGGIQFSPVWAHAYAEKWMFSGVKRVILTSATLQKSVMKYMGINEKDAEFIETSSTFAKERRPIIYVPTTKVDRHMTDSQKRIWANKIDSIIDKRLHVKGIVHTYSYDRAEMLMRLSRHQAVLMVHDSRTTRHVVEAFIRAEPPAVLVSPAVSEGYDFYGDLARFQIIAKVPFIDTRPLVTQARIKSDKMYQNYLTSLKIIQQYGRGMRSEEDWCETIIVDDNWQWFISMAIKRKLIPAWVAIAIVKHLGIPPAMKEPK